MRMAIQPIKSLKVCVIGAGECLFSDDCGERAHTYRLQEWAD